jgi:hypothetical protein
VTPTGPQPERPPGAQHASGRVVSEARRLVRLVVVAAVTMWPPLVAGRIILGPTATTMLLFGALVGFVNTAAGGRRVGAVASVVFILMAPVALVAGQDALAGTCLMAVGCLAVGTSTYWKRFAGFHVGLVALLFIVTSPTTMVEKMDGGPSESRYFLAVLLGTAVAAFWPVVFAPLMHVVNAVPKEAHFEKPDTVRYTIVTTVLVSAATFYALAFARDSHGVWLPLTLLMVLQVAPGATRHRALQRVWGTIAGAMLAAVVATAFGGTWVVGVVGIVVFLGMLATVGREPYSVFAFFLTTVVLLGVSATEPPLEASAERVVYTLIGSGIALLVYLLKVGISHEEGREAPAT